ncbi:MAG: 50S ribosomal protein L19 [Candidatus Sungbacteria bacterium RIFCSPLOWO2_01_FULL_60_25]|uniref:Large ribosomal subunit protein bL19 n=1 Tax=Candidatus Sungbacteria bacterium RIFCSPLOWO2_01_FULL_60_25 TaxID=1802281 RepID=A0A1G2LFS7_9BACT|nr:MAG: 50S ribosomal protein L19 [Candidatus Sungbacteria bacterium RIFCSPLOWO2_01_FULL_60_25]
MDAINAFVIRDLKKLPDIRSGDIIRVSQKIREGEKERIQAFEGLVIARKHGRGISATITVRKTADGIGVERIFPLHSPTIQKIDVLKHSKTRRAKLYFIRDKAAKEARRNLRSQAIAQTAEPEAQSRAEESAV